jgi:hypothetical protein
MEATPENRILVVNEGDWAVVHTTDTPRNARQWIEAHAALGIYCIFRVVEAGIEVKMEEVPRRAVMRTSVPATEVPPSE